MPTVFRVCRTESTRYAAQTAAGGSLYAEHGAIAAALRAALPETTAQLFARPVNSADGASTDWTTELPGQPQPLSTLPPEARAKAKTLLAERLAAVRALAARTPDAAVADAIRRAAVDPGVEQVYVVNGQPVVVGWGNAGVGAVPVVPAAAPVAAAVAGRSWGKWLLGLLLALALIALALFLLRRCEPEPPPPPTAEEPKAPEPPPEDDLSDLKARIAAAEAELKRRLEACKPPEEPPKAVDPPKVEPPKPVEPAKPAPKPVAPKPEPKPAPKPAEPKPPVAKPAEPPPQKQAACPAPRQEWERPEVMLMLDGSGSMRLPSSMTDDQVRGLIQRAMRGDRAAFAQLQGYSGGAGSRLQAAKDAVKGVVQQMPADVDIGLLVFGRCEGTDSFNFFSPAQRGALLGQVNGIQPREGTPLARGLERSGNQLDGVSVPGVIVVVTDGADSCGGDPCAVARALKQKKPNLKINVIGVDGSGAGKCMAEATGGRFLTPRQGQSWGDLLMDATEQKPLPPGCK